MPSTSLRALICVISALSAPLASTADWHVATDGDNGAAGTAQEPFATIAHAVSLAVPGDTVWIDEGSYFEDSIELGAAGSEALPIRIASMPGTRAIVDGAQADSATAPIFRVTGSWYFIDDLEIRNAPRSAISLQGGQYLHLRNNWIHGSGRSAVYPYDGASHLRAFNNRIYDNAQDNNPVGSLEGGWPSALNLTDMGDLILDNDVFQNYGEGIGAYGQGHLIRGNALHDNYSVDLYANNLVDSEVSGNFIYTLDLVEFHRDGAAAGGIHLANEIASDPNQFRNNRIVNNIVVGPRRRCLRQWNGFGGDPIIDSLIAHNTFACSATDRAIVFDAGPHTGTVFRDNLVWQMNASRPLIQFLGEPSGISFLRNGWFGGNAGPGNAAGAGDVLLAPMLHAPLSTSPYGTRLRDDSPLRDAAGDSADPGVDFFGVARPIGSASDIGAHEFDDLIFADGLEPN